MPVAPAQHRLDARIARRDQPAQRSSAVRIDRAAAANILEVLTLLVLQAALDAAKQAEVGHEAPLAGIGSSGRSVSIHPGEELLADLRQRQKTPEGRAQPRERVAVEHALDHVGHWNLGSA